MNPLRLSTLSAALLLALAATASSCASADPALLEQTGQPSVCRNPAGEFGAGGCAVVSGRVVGARDQPIPGRGLAGGISAREGCGACNSPGIVIDSLGRFSETVYWFSMSAPDSALAVVRVAAVGPGYPQEGTRPAYSDSARVVLRFARTGERAKPAAEVVLRLPVP